MITHAAVGQKIFITKNMRPMSTIQSLAVASVTNQI